jgi:hypothetical protein
MNPINIIMEIYMQVLQKMLKINNYLRTYMQVYNVCKKTTNYLKDLYVGIAHLKWPYENYNRKDTRIAQCSF